MTNVTILGVFRMHEQKEYGKVLEMKSTYIHNILGVWLKRWLSLQNCWLLTKPNADFKLTKVTKMLTRNSADQTKHLISNQA